MDPIIFEIVDNLTLCSPMILALGILIGIVYYSRLEDVYRLLFLFLIMALIIDQASRYLGTYYGNNLILIPVYGLLELLILSRLYFKFLNLVKSNIWYIPIGILVLYNFYEIVMFFNADPKDFNSHSRAFDSLALVIMSIVFFIKQIAAEDPLKPRFLFLNTIIFVFHSLNAIFYLPLNFLINEDSDVKFHFWAASLILTLIFYSSITYSIWIHGKNRKR